jgi:hypothetical protein
MNKKYLVFLILILTICITMIGFIGCSDSGGDDDGDDDDLATVPDALPENDNSSAGVYKGVLVGSSGIFKIIIDNGTGEYSVYIKFDGIEATLTTSDFNGWNPGDAIVNATFTGTLNGETVTFTFSVDADGSNPVVTVAIPGHTLTATPIKETSDELVKCFEGTAVQDGDDYIIIWNFALKGSDIDGSWIKLGESENNGPITATYINGIWSNASNGDPEELTLTGSLESIEVSGTWEQNGDSGTWSGTRTL